MPKQRGLPSTTRMRHDHHFVEQLAVRHTQGIGQKIPIDSLIPNPHQPRQLFEAIDELVASIQEVGVLEPLLVRQSAAGFQIISGERRYRAAVEAADLVLIPCRPSAFDLAAIKTTASLVKMRGKPAFVIFTAGSPTAPRMYDEAAQLVQGYGLDACPLRVADRAAFRHAATEGKTVMEIEPNGKAADEVRQLYKWACEHVNMPADRKRRASA